MDGLIDERKDGWIDGRANRLMDRLMDGRID